MTESNDPVMIVLRGGAIALSAVQELRPCKVTTASSSHWPARSPRRGWSRAPGSAMSDGTEAVARAASTARNRFVKY
jgi:hypothetical protein